MALRPFKGMRAALESARGTGVAPTRGIPFTSGTHIEEIDLIYPEELRNSLFAHYTADVGTEVNALEFEGIVGYNSLPWWANLHIKAVASGTGAGSDKTWTFTPSSTDDLKTASIEFGYSDSISATAPVVQLYGCIGDQFSMKWDKTPGNSGVTFTSRLATHKSVTQLSAFTGTGTYTAEAGGLVKASATTVSIDTTTIGTTPDSYVMAVEWTLNNGPVPLHTLNGTAAAQAMLRPNPWAWTAKVRRYYQNDTEWDARRAGTIRKVRIVTTGPVLGSGTYKVQLDLYGKYQDRTTSEADGLGIEEFTLVPVYDTGTSSDFSLIVVNDQASIT